jgi:hypothetical protein
LLAATGFGWAAYAHSLVSALFAFGLAAVGYWSMMGPFWALPTRVLGGQAAAGGVAIITMVGSLGGFAGPALTGKLKDMTHNYTAGLLMIGGLAVDPVSLTAFCERLGKHVEHQFIRRLKCDQRRAAAGVLSVLIALHRGKSVLSFSSWRTTLFASYWYS